jgi:NAD(P)-dependent dehydrogenase (short-subunit alcohol dehydrogenase family)
MPRVLVTGAGRGIGLATVQRLAAAGWDVIAGVRQAQDGERVTALAPSRITPATLDITDAEQVAALDGVVAGQLDAVVNNAGIAVTGPLEGLALADLRRQLEINVTGQLAVTQAVLPALRASRGRIVFVSSLSGRVANPMMGAYNASKYALEGMADALRMELSPWGVKVVLVEPAQTDTDLWRNADETVEQTVAALSDEHRQLYDKHITGMRKGVRLSQKMAAPVEGAAAVIEKALTAGRPRARYVVGRPARVQAGLLPLTPTPVLDFVMKAASGVPRRP